MPEPIPAMYTIQDECMLHRFPGRKLGDSIRVEICLMCGLYYEEGRACTTETCQPRKEIFQRPKTTHILIEYPDQNYERLCRVDTGVVIGERKNQTYIFGPEPNKRQSHYFMDDESAKAWHQTYADRDLKACRQCAGYGLLATAFKCPHCDGSGVAHADAPPAMIERRNGSPILALPADSLDIATNVRPMRH